MESQPFQERMLVNVESDMQSMQSALAALQGELGTEMQSQLDSGDQREVGVSHLSSSSPPPSLRWKN